MPIRRRNRERERNWETEEKDGKGGRREGRTIFFTPLAEFRACRGPCASLVFRCCDNRGERGERIEETDREMGRGESAD